MGDNCELAHMCTPMRAYRSYSIRPYAVTGDTGFLDIGALPARTPVVARRLTTAVGHKVTRGAARQVRRPRATAGRVASSQLAFLGCETPSSAGSDRPRGFTTKARPLSCTPPGGRTAKTDLRDRSKSLPPLIVRMVAMCQHRMTMPLFGRRSIPVGDEERQAAAVDLERIRDGGIPLGAEQRLKQIAVAGSPVFSSDLSAKEYAVAQVSGFTPIAQIMGSSVVQHGWQNYGWSAYGGGVREMSSFAAPWNLSRQRSFDRLRQEAQFAGADAVIGIEMTAKAFLGDPGNVEYAVFGTAVRETMPARRTGSSAPVLRMCALSGQDVYKLRRIGAETLGVIGHTSVVCVALGASANQMMRSWWGNQEMVEITEGVYAARRLAMDEVRRQAVGAGANEMVISTLTHHIDHHEYEGGGYTRHFFIVSMHVLGTAVVLGAHEPHPTPLGVPVMSINLGS